MRRQRAAESAIFGAGVSAGLDFALALVALIRGRPYAEALMLQGEYSPRPPFKGGTLDTTDPAIAGPFADMFAGLAARVTAPARHALTGAKDDLHSLFT